MIQGLTKAEIADRASRAGAGAYGIGRNLLAGAGRADAVWRGSAADAERQFQMSLGSATEDLNGACQEFSRLYGEAGLQGFFFVVNIYGWWLWARAGGAEHAVTVRWMGWPARLAWLAGIALAGVSVVAAHAQPVVPAGQPIYETRCKGCHEGGNPRAPAAAIAKFMVDKYGVDPARVSVQ